MKRGEIAAARRVEQVLDAVVVEEKRVTAGAGEERDVAGGGDVRLVADERNRNVGEDLLADGFDVAGLLAGGQIHIDGLLAVARFGEDIAESDVVQQVSV